MCEALQIILAAYEIADRLVDIFMVSNYANGDISNNPKESVAWVLRLLWIITLPMTLLRVFFYYQRWTLLRSGDNSEDEKYVIIDLWMSWAKTLVEAFPQATIAKFYFGDCAPKDSARIMVHVFDVFSIVAFLMFTFYFCIYSCFYLEEQNRVKVYSAAVFTLLCCLIGCIFAGISITDFNTTCSRLNSKP